jgi:hypothetical protein
LCVGQVRQEARQCEYEHGFGSSRRSMRSHDGIPPPDQYRTTRRHADSVRGRGDNRLLANASRWCYASWCEAIHSATRHPHAICRLSLKLKHGGGNLVDGKFNDPRNPQLLTENLFSFSLWIGYGRVPDDDWHIADVQVTVNPGPQHLQFISAVALPLRLAQEFGEFCFLRSIRP